MRCEQYDEALTEAALGGPASSRLEAHLQGCLDCGRRLAEEQARLQGFDRALRSALRVEPGAAFSGRVASCLAQRKTAPWWSSRRDVGLAAGLAVVVLAGWLARRPPTPAVSRAEAVATATVPPVTDGAPAGPKTPASARSTMTEAAAPRLVRVGRPPARPRPGTREPEVLVPPGEEDALRRFVASLHTGAPPPPLLMTSTSVEDLVESPAAIEILPLETRPLARPADPPERSPS